MKNVGEVTVAVVGKGNYAGSVERTYRITPASLMVTTGSDSKIYDGSELVNNELSIEGLQGEDRVTAAATGSQTEVGSSENTYRITWGDVDAANYVIDEHLGTLTVTPAPVPPTPNPDDGTTPTPEPTPSPTPATARRLARLRTARRRFDSESGALRLPARSMRWPVCSRARTSR